MCPALVALPSTNTVRGSAVRQACLGKAGVLERELVGIVRHDGLPGIEEPPSNLGERHAALPCPWSEHPSPCSLAHLSQLRQRYRLFFSHFANFHGRMV